MIRPFATYIYFSYTTNRFLIANHLYQFPVSNSYTVLLHYSHCVQFRMITIKALSKRI